MFVLLAALHGAILLVAPAVAVIALGVWWGSNTIAHNFIHRPFFKASVLNAIFSSYLSLLLGVPQAIWRNRHLAHHAGRAPTFRLTPQILCEIALVLSSWAILMARAPAFFLTVYLPGYAAGLALCALHGHYEHKHGTTDHVGKLYNLLFFNDGYHVEHHANPSTHWSRLPECALKGIQRSRWPAVLRWLDAFGLESLERRVLHSPVLQRFVLRRHEHAFRKLLPNLGSIRDVAIVGGGLFPRTALILQRLVPGARLVVIDASADNIAVARESLAAEVEFINARYDPQQHAGFDLVVIPLSFVGDRAAIYRDPPARAVMVHDWIWRRHGTTALISVLLLKRLNLVLG